MNNLTGDVARVLHHEVRRATVQPNAWSARELRTASRTRGWRWVR
jgi:hypothetical protein